MSTTVQALRAAFEAGEFSVRLWRDEDGDWMIEVNGLLEDAGDPATALEYAGEMLRVALQEIR